MLRLVGTGVVMQMALACANDTTPDAEHVLAQDSMGIASELADAGSSRTTASGFSNAPEGAESVYTWQVRDAGGSNTVSTNVGAVMDSGATHSSGEGIVLVPMLSALIDGERFDFRDDVRAYNGRPPAMDISGGTLEDTPLWHTLRVVVTPAESLTPGEYECGPNHPHFIMLIGESGVFDTTTVATTCTIVVEAAGNQSGQVFSGRFEATLFTTDGARSVELKDGTFVGIAEGSGP